MAKVTHLGPAKPDDPIYKSGPVVGGKRIGDPKRRRRRQAVLRVVAGASRGAAPFFQGSPKSLSLLPHRLPRGQLASPKLKRLLK